ncbi:hypothetical protein ABD76_18440 [Paenibacillus dendritiformis]|uniref:tetratricopeptide repeat protein n=1 Tax=Paenibacillus dendritiformis TaxID=130049 RepID=UPI0018CD01AE|nr:hypothetical protein [Paenibacillus dendritiformis]MBG9794377.1 hypothetical protein [Paenibacillus dendritiformis]
MKKRCKQTLIVSCFTAAVIAAISIISYVNWTKPYDLPKLDPELTINDFNLDFSLERETGSLQPGLTNNDLLAMVKQSPENLVYSTELRLRMNRESQTEKFIDLMNEIEPTSDIVLQQALAYVDMLQDPDLGTAALGQKSVHSISLLEDILQENPYDIPAHYARGLNNLYWPQGLKRADKAVQDFAFCIAVEQMNHELKFAFWPDIYAAFGDALVKAGDVSAGIAVWKEGYEKYPNDAALSQRAGADENTAYDIVKQERGIDGFKRPDPAISDISKLWKG